MYALNSSSIRIALIATLAASSLRGQEAIVRYGYNTLEGALTTQQHTRVRTNTNVTVSYGDIRLGYTGRNEAVLAGTIAHQGRHAFYVGSPRSPLSLVGVLKTNTNGISDAKIGVRDNTIVKALRGKGFLDVTSNRVAVNVSAVYLRDITKKTRLEAFNGLEMPYGGGPSYRGELQWNQYIGPRAALFARAEVIAGKQQSTTYVGGILIRITK